jgi:intracellular septation protein
MTKEPGWLKPATDFGPLAVFLAAYWLGGLMAATAALMGATVLALGVSWLMVRRLPTMALITAGIVGVFGGLTLLLHDETFIKMKPTIVQLLFAAVLLGGVLARRQPLRWLMGQAWAMNDAGWRTLSIRFGIFFLAMAGLNEIVWRTQSTDLWVNFKVFGIGGLTVLFALTQVPLMNRYRVEERPPEVS